MRPQLTIHKKERKHVYGLLHPVLGRQPLHIRPALIDPLLLYQLLPICPIQPINQLDRALADTSNCTDVPHRFHLAKEVACEVDGTACNRHWTSPICDAMFTSGDNDVATNRLDIRRKVEVIAVPYQ
jgi:hypothetical protein